MLFHNNPTPSLLVVEQGSTPDTISAGQQRQFIDSVTHRMNRVDSSAVVRDVEAIQATLDADPASPVNGTWWVTDDGGSPASVALKFRKGGVTYTLAEVTV